MPRRQKRNSAVTLDVNVLMKKLQTPQPILLHRLIFLVIIAYCFWRWCVVAGMCLRLGFWPGWQTNCYTLSYVVFAIMGLLFSFSRIELTPIIISIIDFLFPVTYLTSLYLLRSRLYPHYIRMTKPLMLAVIFGIPAAFTLALIFDSRTRLFYGLKPAQQKDGQVFSESAPSASSEKPSS